jgi:hypothetical protein
MRGLRHVKVKYEMGPVSMDPEVGKRSLPLGHGVPDADVHEETSAVGASPLELLVPSRSSAQAVRTKSIGARAKEKSARVVAAAGGRPSGEQHEDVLVEELVEDGVFTDYDFLHVRGVEFDGSEVLTNSRRL